MRRLIDNGDAPAKKKPLIGHYGHLRKAYLDVSAQNFWQKLSSKMAKEIEVIQ